METARTHFFSHREPQTDADLCVRVLLRYHGIEAAALRAIGPTMLDIYNVLSDAGLDVHGYEGSVATLQSVSGPSILHLRLSEDESRFVICFGYESGRFVIGDPGCGILLYSARDLARRWTSRALLAVGGPRGNEQRFKRFGVSFIPFGRARTLACAHTTQSHHVLSGAETEALLAACRFRTLDGHDARIHTHAVRHDRGPVSSVDSSTLTSWVEESLIISEAELRKAVVRLRTTDAGTPEPGRRITTIGIPTRERNGALARALRSYLTSARHHGPHPRFLIAGTPEPDGRTELEEDLDALRQEFGAEIVYLDVHTKERMAAHVASETGCRKDLVRFALLGDARFRSDYGANRNALLLATAGELCILVDDDTLPPDAVLPSFGSGIEVSSRFDPNDYWFDEPPWGSIPASDVDFVGLHQDMLGRHPRSVLGEYAGDDVSVEALESPLLELLKRPDAYIGLTFLGHEGDAGTATNGWRLFLEGQSLERLVAPGYQERVRRRTCGRTVIRRTISDGHFCAAMNLGLDNRQALPPFMPVGRNEDGVFSAALSATAPNCLRGFREGFVIRHAPLEFRSPFPAPIRFEGLKANDMLAMLIRELCAIGAYGSRASLKRLGRDLAELGRLEQGEFDAWVRSFVLRNLGLAVGEVEHGAAVRGSVCQELGADLSTYLRSMEAYVLRNDCDVPIDLDGTSAERRQRFRTLIRRYGELLTCWPDLMQCARTIQIDALVMAPNREESPMS